MAIPLFHSFRSTVTPFIAREWARLRLLVDPVTGAPAGVQSLNANGPDGVWAPIDLTAAQIAAPTAAMLADLNAVYRLNEAPYTRYYSSGGDLVAYSAAIIGTNQIAYSPLTVSDPGGLSVRASLYVIAGPPA